MNFIIIVVLVPCLLLLSQLVPFEIKREFNLDQYHIIEMKG